jgi:hypothetical protein
VCLLDNGDARRRSAHIEKPQRLVAIRRHQHSLWFCAAEI